MRSDPAMTPRLRIRVLAGAILVVGLLAAPSALRANGGTAAPRATGAQATAPTAPSTTPTSPAPPPAGPPSPCALASPRLRCPDLTMSAPSDLHLDRTTIPGRVLLRATSSI